MDMVQRWRFGVSINFKIHQSAGHNEGVIGTLDYEIENDGLSTMNHPYIAKYYITAGYGENSDVLDSVKGQQRSSDLNSPVTNGVSTPFRFRFCINKTEMAFETPFIP